jgi:DNA invertase Pin-like site-specific DNA recombinase
VLAAKRVPRIKGTALMRERDSMIKGYARVSTDGQDLASQHEALRAAGAEQVFAEKISAAQRDRPTLERLLVR